MDTTGKMFFYHAHGSALGGVIRWPVNEVIDSVAATSLPITGGYGSNRAGEYNLKEIIRCSGAHSEVSGSRNDGDNTHNTEVTSVVEHLNINNVVTADRIVGRLSSRHRLDQDEGEITPVGSEYVNLRIAGCPVEVELDANLFNECNTFDKFKRKHQQDPEFRKAARQRFLWGDVDKTAPDWLQQRYNWVKPDAMPESKGIVPCSLVKSIRCSCPELKIYGNVVIVPNFGKIFLAEILLKQNSRRLTMMRLELGSPVGGSVTVCGIEGNGTSYP